MKKGKQRFKHLFNPLVTGLVVNKFCWSIISVFIRTADWFLFTKNEHDRLKAEQKLSFLFKEKTVLSGFFRGLKYPSLKAYGSGLFPKLIGSYENELYETLVRFGQNTYNEIIDIGCAEGYYAVGLALQFKQTKVYAFDINDAALEYCKLMAIENGVNERMIFGSICTAETIEKFHFTGRSLIICDCEGYERLLFDQTNINNLKQSDMIIEMHSFIYKDVKDYLINLFSDTHICTIVSSHDRARKLNDFKDVLEGMNTTEKLKVIEEGRPFTMDWLVLTSKM